MIHGISHVHHKGAHSTTDEIEEIVTTGIYSKIRHPGYLGIIPNVRGLFPVVE